MKKLESVIFYLLIFSIPFQSRIILHEWTRPFNQWTSAYLYGTDILMAAVFVLWLARGLESNFSKFSISKLLNQTSFWLVVFFAVSAISVVGAHIRGLSWYQLLKLAEFLCFFFYLRSNVGKIFHFQSVLAVAIVSGFFQAVIGIVQYLKQGSIGLRLLGESPLSVNATGVAVFIADGLKYLRAYGATPHPNILAAWLFVAIFSFYFWYLYSKGKRDYFLFVYVVLLFGFFFSFSRVVIGLWVFGVSARLLLVFLKKEFWRNDAIRRGTLKLTAVSAVVVVVFSFLYWPQVQSRIHISSQEEAVTQRIFYNKIAESTAASHPFIGVGLGQSIPDLMSKFKHLPADAYQPAHNVYLLIASETGFIGLGMFAVFLFFVFYGFIRGSDFEKLWNFSFFIFAFSFLIFGFFDHFLWTSQQGGLIFWMVMALLVSRIDVV